MRRRLIECLRRSSGGRWENLVWRNGLCDWCRGCMPMSVLVRGTVKSLKWRSVFTKAQYSAHCGEGSVLSPLLFIIVLKVLSCEFCSEVPRELYADDLVIIAKLLEECVRRLLTWKEAMEEKGMRINARKTKIMICDTGLDLLQSSGEFPCTVSHWSGQQQHLLQQLQALGAQ